MSSVLTCLSTCLPFNLLLLIFVILIMFYPCRAKRSHAIIWEIVCSIRPGLSVESFLNYLRILSPNSGFISFALPTFRCFLSFVIRFLFSPVELCYFICGIFTHILHLSLMVSHANFVAHLSLLFVFVCTLLIMMVVLIWWWLVKIQPCFVFALLGNKSRTHVLGQLDCNLRFCPLLKICLVGFGRMLFVNDHDPRLQHDSGLILQDLTFINEGNNDLLPDGKINFEKQWQYFNRIDEMRRLRIR